MSLSGSVITRVVKPAAGPVKAPVVIPAAKISSVGLVVVTFPLVAVVDVPELEAVASNGLVWSSRRTR